MKYFALVGTTEETEYCDDYILSHWIGDDSLPNPDLSQFKTQKEIQGDNEFYECEEEYEAEVDKVEVYLQKLGYDRMKFTNIGL